MRRTTVVGQRGARQPKRQVALSPAWQGGEHLMFTRNRTLAAAMAVGLLAIAGPVAAASAAPTSSVQATVGAAGGFHGFGNPGHYGYPRGNSWNNGYGYG